MSQLFDKYYLKFFYISEFLISSALGMIPLMTILSFMLSSLSNSSFAYAIVLALYNISTTVPKMYVAKNLSGKSNTFKYLLSLRSVQLMVWLCMSLLFVFNEGQSYLIVIFCVLYLIYAVVKGSMDVLNIDIYSRLIDRNNLGKFFGYKYSLNSLAEFIGAVILVGLFERLHINNYAVIFMCVFILDLLSFCTLFYIRNKCKLSDEAEIGVQSFQISDNVCVSNGIFYTSGDVVACKKGLLSRVFSYIRVYLSALKEDVRLIIKSDLVYSRFLKINIISILGASVASFFIPYATDRLQLTMTYISIANVIWLVSKVVSSVLWGYIVDLVGSKYAMIGSRVALLCSYLLAINLKNTYMFYLIMILHGVSSSALVLMAQNIFIEISGNKGALYSAINSVVCMPFFMVMPLVTSFLSENFGYKVSFMISMIPLIISVIGMFGVKIKKIKK